MIVENRSSFISFLGFGQRYLYFCVWSCINITFPFSTGKYLPLGYKGDRGGRDHRTGQKEDGVGPSGDSAHGYHWPDGPGKQLGKVQVRDRKMGGVGGVAEANRFYIKFYLILQIGFCTTDVSPLSEKGRAKTAGRLFHFIMFSLFLLPLFCPLVLCPCTLSFLPLLAVCFWLCVWHPAQQCALQ